MSNTILAWHFTGPTLRDGQPIPPNGEWLEHSGPVVLCESGLHASVRLIDALNFAPGATLHRVSLSGTIKQDSNKVVASHRLIHWHIDATEMLRLYARQCALAVDHLWDMPAVVRQYLETGDEEIKDAASAAAWVAARDPARDVASAATAAARAAARAAASAASAAARYAANAASTAAGAAASAAAWVAARDPAWDVASDAAWVAARDAASAAAWVAARVAQSDRLNVLITAEAKRHGLALNPEIV